MISIYDFSGYKAFVNGWLDQLPNKGHGQRRKMAQFLGVSTTMISQVFSGDKHINLELAAELGDYLGLNEREAEYFLLLVEYERAGSVKLERHFKRTIERKQKQAMQLKNRMKPDVEISQEAMGIFYSDWSYSAARMLSALEGVNSEEEISRRLNLPRHQVHRLLQFLIDNRLCVDTDQGIQVGPSRTHIPADSPFVSQHHKSWRQVGFNNMSSQNSDNLFYTGPMSLSAKTAERVRKELPKFIEQINKWVAPSKSEVVRCLNIDWFNWDHS